MLPRVALGLLVWVGVLSGWADWSAAQAPTPVAAAAAGDAGGTAPVQRCASLRLHGQADAAQACYERLSTSEDMYLRAEGAWGLDDYAQANDDFRSALARDNQSALIRVRWGRLLHQRFNDTDAVGLFQEALKIDPRDAAAYLGLALVSADGFDGKAADYAHKAVALDPALAPAHELLGELALEDSDPIAAGAEADLALKAQPDELDAMAVHAAIDALALRSPQAWLDRIDAINPHYGQADELIANQLELGRRYHEAIVYYRKAIALSPDLWSAHSELGIALMRLGEEKEPETQLEIAYNNDYRDVATVDSLRLLDSYKNFNYIHDGDILLKLDKKESALLAPYFEALIQQAMAHYSSEYGITLPIRSSGHGDFKVQVEAYPNHSDFAVRALGVPGLGALGVTFDDVVAMDSPSGRPPGDFNWGSTLWHELNHVYVLTLTHNLVPRWFAEGLAVHAEGQANPEWAERITPDGIAAIQNHQLLPVAELDRGFIHPTYPNQVLVSYYQAEKICDYIQDRWGAEKLVAMARDFAVPTTTSAVIEKALGMTPAAFDTAFDAWLMKSVGTEVQNFAAWNTQLKKLATAVESRAGPETIIPMAKQVIALYPDYVYDANAYGFLAAAQIQAHDNAGALATLVAYEQRGGTDISLLKQLANLQAGAGDKAGAVATLSNLNDIYPMETDTHRQLGRLDLELNNTAGAIQEFTAVLALHPLDQAGAEYDLARAEFAAGHLESAQDAVIAALVAAHDYRPAQDLLVKIMAAEKQQKGPS